MSLNPGHVDFSYELDVFAHDRKIIGELTNRVVELTSGDDVIIAGVRGDSLEQLLVDDRPSTFGIRSSDFADGNLPNVNNPINYALKQLADESVGFRGLFLYRRRAMLLEAEYDVPIIWRSVHDETPVNTAVDRVFRINLIS